MASPVSHAELYAAGSADTEATCASSWVWPRIIPSDDVPSWRVRQGVVMASAVVSHLPERFLAAGEVLTELPVGLQLPSGTVTFLLTDIEGSTRAWERDPESMGELVAAHYSVVESAISTHYGYRPVEQGEGDSVVAVFAWASDGVAAALDAQRRLD